MLPLTNAQTQILHVSQRQGIDDEVKERGKSRACCSLGTCSHC